MLQEEEDEWPRSLNKDESQDEDLFDCNCSCTDRIKQAITRALNKPIHPITLRVQDDKTRAEFFKFSRAQVLSNLKIINVLIIVSVAILFLTQLSNIKEQGILLLFYLDVILVGILVQLLGKHYGWIVDHGPTLLILCRTCTLGLFLYSNHKQWF